MHTLLETLYNILTLVTEDFRNQFPTKHHALLRKLDEITVELGNLLDTMN